MVSALEHRGPDGSAVWVHPGLSLGLGHSRLSIVDLSSAGLQPMTSASGRWTITYNGEIYNAPEIAARLSNFNPRGHSDTEVLVEAIDQWGVEGAVNLLNGMFAFGAWDNLQQDLWLARDRYGQKPLYLAEIDGSTVFASELGALRKIANASFRVRPDAVSELLRLGRIPGDRCIYEGVEKLPPGHLLKIPYQSGVARTLVEYWNPEDVANAQLEKSVGREEVEDCLRDAVGIRLRSDVPQGVFLSGGVDSTLVAALAAQASPSQIRTFTVKPDSGTDESMFAQQAADHLGTDHTELSVTGTDAIELVPRLGSIWDEPFADSSQIPTYLLAEKAREHVVVVLGGDGGDEIFAGYNRHVWMDRVARWSKRAPGTVLKLATGLLRSRAVRQLEIGQQALPSRSRLPLAENKALKLAALLDSPGDPLAALTELWPDPPVRARGSCPTTGGANALVDPLRNILVADILSYLPDDILVKTDRGSMAHGLEMRAPFLDHRLWALSCGLPTDMLVRGMRGKVILREMAGAHVPSSIFERPKTGFGIPLDEWLRSDLREWAGDMLNGDALQKSEFLEPKPILDAWNVHLSAERNLDQQLWPVLMFQAWMQDKH